MDVYNFSKNIEGQWVNFVIKIQEDLCSAFCFINLNKPRIKHCRTILFILLFYYTGLAFRAIFLIFAGIGKMCYCIIAQG